MSREKLENRSQLVKHDERAEETDELDDVEQVDQLNLHACIIPHSGEEASLETEKCLVSCGRKCLSNKDLAQRGRLFGPRIKDYLGFSIPQHRNYTNGRRSSHSRYLPHTH